VEWKPRRATIEVVEEARTAARDSICIVARQLQFVPIGAMVADLEESVARCLGRGGRNVVRILSRSSRQGHVRLHKGSLSLPVVFFCSSFDID
jgi:hypothetical protein